ncbi:GNAT family N-acetyltransferase [Brevundimonas sp. 2R-24]|uniref:GNAT family N-acetyltransferase n=1 Tax=Peiella sedimenti TaxID=3061083 RepID=A0ABT8SKW6_9CAUL|nr:GNAT family N-acetyltransferase [Caulobacteraceae bacterium XZ-24]
MSLSVRVHPAIADIGETTWNALAAPTANPFLDYAFLEALEASGCVGERTGWRPCHLELIDDGATLGLMPLYLKSHSQGEYVFDHGWADAYERAGGRYYPKLLSAVPFTPVTAPKLLVGSGPDADAQRQALLTGALEFCGQIGASSLHVNFLPEAEAEALGQAGLLRRQDVQFWWENRGYQTFDDFLADLSSSRRKVIRRERREACRDLEITAVTGADLTEVHWDAFFAFYMDTGARKWGRPYLNRRFFSLIGQRMADRIVLMLAARDGRYIAGALNFIGGDTLYGRQWGALEDAPFLHFELCYYRAIDFAIARDLNRVEAGAQGEHKLARGYLPHHVHSAHFIADPALREPVAAFLARERPAVAEHARLLEQELTPFKAQPRA